VHTVDTDSDGALSLSELLRIIQHFNFGSLGCRDDTEDGYGPSADYSCAPHASDYSPQNWRIGFTELLRAIQFYNMGGYFWCPDAFTVDGYCAPGQ
jgi:hypothetical protein